MRSAILTVLRWSLLVLATLGGPAAQAASLHWSFKPGETLHYEMTEKTITTLSVSGQANKTTVTQTIDLSWAVKDVDPRGTAELAQTMDRVRLKVEIAGDTFEYDSKDTKEPEGPMGMVAPFLKVLIGTPFPFKMDPQGTLSDIRVPEKVTKALREMGEAAAGAGEMFTEEGLKTMITQQSIPLPKGDVAEGKTWTQTSKVPAPPVGSMVLEKTYRYQGPDPKLGGGVEKIGVEVKVQLDNAPDAKVAVKIKSQDAKGALSFDNAAGRALGSNLVSSIEKVALIEKNEVSQKVETTVTLRLIPEKAAGAAK